MLGSVLGQDLRRLIGSSVSQGNLDAINTLAKEISAAGRAAETAQVDALDEQAVASHLDAVVDKAGTVDISFNAIGIPQHGIQGIPLTGLASGSAVSRAGDWFGSPVNVASRVTGVARPGVVLVAESARDAIASADGFDWSVAGARHLKGVKGAAAVATIGGTAADIRGASDVVLWGSAVRCSAWLAPYYCRCTNRMAGPDAPDRSRRHESPS